MKQAAIIFATCLVTTCLATIGLATIGHGIGIGVEYAPFILVGLAILVSSIIVLFRKKNLILSLAISCLMLFSLRIPAFFIASQLDMPILYYFITGVSFLLTILIRSIFSGREFLNRTQVFIFALSLFIISITLKFLYVSMQEIDFSNFEYALKHLFYFFYTEHLILAGLGSNNLSMDLSHILNPAPASGGNAVGGATPSNPAPAPGGNAVGGATPSNPTPASSGGYSWAGGSGSNPGPVSSGGNPEAGGSQSNLAGTRISHDFKNFDNPLSTHSLDAFVKSLEKRVIEVIPFIAPGVDGTVSVRVKHLGIFKGGKAHLALQELNPVTTNHKSPDFADAIRNVHYRQAVVATSNPKNVNQSLNIAGSKNLNIIEKIAGKK